MAEWDWQDRLSPGHLVAIFACISLSLALMVGAALDAVGHSMDREVVATATLSDTSDTSFVAQDGHYSFDWRTLPGPEPGTYHWNVQVRLERATGELVVEGSAAWEEQLQCTGQGAGRNCQPPGPAHLMDLDLEAGGYRLLLTTVHVNATTAGAPPGAQVEVSRALPLPDLDMALMVAGAVVGVGWILPLAWWLHRDKRRFELEDAAYTSEAAPVVVQGPGQGRSR